MELEIWHFASETQTSTWDRWSRSRIKGSLHHAIRFKTSDAVVVWRNNGADDNIRGTRGHSWKLAKFRRTQDCCKYFFSNRVINTRWNQLDQRSVGASSINVFKGYLNKIGKLVVAALSLNSTGPTRTATTTGIPRRLPLSSRGSRRGINSLTLTYTTRDSCITYTSLVFLSRIHALSCYYLW